MSTTIGLTFPWGRYHATQWGRDSNEGVVDWPPSPWRLLRALYSSWKTRCPDLTGDTVAGLLQKLTGEPRFWLPDSRPGHTRHYYPETEHRRGASGGSGSKTKLTLDSFIAFDKHTELFVTFDAVLEQDERVALGRLCEGLSYLGRAESICDARLVDDEVDRSALTEWAPQLRGGQQADVLCPMPGIGSDLLTITPFQIRKSKRITPPGAQWVTYSAPAPAPPKIEIPSVDPLQDSGIVAVRYALGSKKLPHLTGVLAVASLARSAALNQFQRQAKRHQKETDDHEWPELSPSLSGRQSAGHRLNDDHSHAHFLVYSATTRDIEHRYAAEVDTLVVFAPGGLSVADLGALARLTRLWPNEHLREVPADIRLAAEAMGSDARELVPEIAGPSKVWQTHTPFVSPRFAKKVTLNEHLRASVLSELAYRPWLAQRADTAKVTILEEYGARRFRTHRPGKEKLHQARRGAMVRIEFEHPVVGPVALGRHAHLGLGLFMPLH